MRKTIKKVPKVNFSQKSLRKVLEKFNYLNKPLVNFLRQLEKNSLKV